MGHKTQQSNRRSVHRNLLDVSSNTHEYSETSEILRPSWLIQSNASEKIVILAAKAKFSITKNSKKVSTDKCDIGKLPEIAVQPPKPEVLISQKVGLDRYHQNSNGKPGVFEHGELEENTPIGDSNNYRQPEMAADTGNTYTSEIITDSVESPTANLGFSITASSKKLCRAIATDNDRQPEIGTLTFGRQSCHVGLSVVVTITWQRFYRASHGRKFRIYHWNFDAICHSSRDISISGFGGHFRLSIIRVLESTRDTLFELAVVENLRFAVGTWMTSFILSKIQILPFWGTILLFPVGGRLRNYCFWDRRGPFSEVPTWKETNLTLCMTLCMWHSRTMGDCCAVIQRHRLPGTVSVTQTLYSQETLLTDDVTTRRRYFEWRYIIVRNFMMPRSTKRIVDMLITLWRPESCPASRNRFRGIWSTLDHRLVCRWNPITSICAARAGRTRNMRTLMTPYGRQRPEIEAVPHVTSDVGLHYHRTTVASVCVGGPV